MDFSFVIPVYNEEREVIESLDIVWGFLSKQNFTFELIIVDDGSTDRTLALIREFSARDGRIIVRELPANQGKGEAVKQGMLAAHGDYRFFFDIDLSVPLETINVFATIIGKQKPEVIIGTRKTRGATIVKKQPFYREWLGKGFTRLTNGILGTSFSDITCGFKCFSSAAAMRIFASQRTKRWSFDSEILFLTKRFGYRFVEVPVTWRNDPDTRVRLLKDVIRSFKELVDIRLHYL